MNIQESYNKKSYFYDDYRKNTPGWEEINNILKNKLNDDVSILDVGCGTGVFLEKLQNFNYKELHGIDPSNSMIEKSYEKIKYIDNCKVWKDYIENIEDDKYDLVFCNQVIQNLTLDKNNAFNIRNNFYNHLYRILKPNGQLILTTRNICDKYSNMYWYADDDILNKSINNMECFVPKDLDYEVRTINKFKNIEILTSNDLIYKNDYYINTNLLGNESWYAADSFWSHVERNNELDNFKNNIEKLKNNNELNSYINNRDKLRNNAGHIKICYCVK